MLSALVRWGSRSQHLRADAQLGTDALILSLRTMFDAAVAGDFEASIEVRIGEDRFRALVAYGELDVARGAAADPDVVIEGEADTLAGVIYTAAAA